MSRRTEASNSMKLTAGLAVKVNGESGRRIYSLLNTTGRDIA